ncbi:hydrogenase maturation protease [Streptomyces sp. NPDC047000]|uniref:hydrogenase maturation protease n=1 Tax=Streptomyces sp. NPDC047000 TaxID=3155474 RepID=UPI003404C739
MAVSTRIAVIAVGDRSRHDAGIGPAVLARLRERAAERPLPRGTALAECDGEPGRLAGLWEKAELAVVVTSAQAHRGRPGRVYRLELDEQALRRPPGTGGPDTDPHGLAAAVELARELARLPHRLVAYAVEAADTSQGPGLSAPVAAEVGAVAGLVEEEIVRHRSVAVHGGA